MFLRRRLLALCVRHGTPHHHYIPIRTWYDALFSMQCLRDRGLDHAVARERHLKPLLNLRDLIFSEHSKSSPLALITQSKEILQIPFRPIEFIRKYPSIFQEFHPGTNSVMPHVKLTSEVISLSSEENLLYQSVNYKQEIATRLIKLLMISRINKVPIFLLERLKWELGLPRDYQKIIFPEFPDYFRIINGKYLGGSGKMLELVCWNDEVSLSEIEKKGAKDGKIQFCLNYSNDFEMDKKYKKWVDEWQKLPYVSPYQNAMHLTAKSDESDKWVVAVLHELLSLFIGKKAERENLLFLGEFLGLRSRFKQALLNHPGIFYVTSKIGVHTVVLRDAYKRGMLIERHPLMGMRFKYVQLMNLVKHEGSEGPRQKSVTGSRKGDEQEWKDNECGKQDDSWICEDSDSSVEGNAECGSDKDYDVENRTYKRRSERKAAKCEQKNSRKSIVIRSHERRRSRNDDDYKNSTTFSRRNTLGGQTFPGRAMRSSYEDDNASKRIGFKRQLKTRHDRVLKG